MNIIGNILFVLFIICLVLGSWELTKTSYDADKAIVKKLSDKSDELEKRKSDTTSEQPESQIQTDRMADLEKRIKDLEAIIARLENIVVSETNLKESNSGKTDKL